MSALVSVLVVLTLLLFATQVLFNLYATSVVGAAAFDAARRAAGADADRDGDGWPDQDALDAAESHARRLLGRYGRERVAFTWGLEDDDGDGLDDVVTLRVEARNPNFLLPEVGAVAALQRVDRTVRVRLERLRGP